MATWDHREPGQWLTDAEDQRLRSWTIDICTLLLPGDIRIDLADVQFAGGLRIQRSTGVWFHHSHGRGGHSIIPLIKLLRACSHEDAVTWARAWLKAHQGYGACNSAEPDDDADDDGRSAAATAAGMERAKEYLAQLLPIEGTPCATYLRKRGISNAIPPWIAWLSPNIARIGEGAVAAVLRVSGATVGAQLTFLADDGTKSQIQPVRRTHLLERTPRTRAATFGTMPEAVELARMAKESATLPLLICEGAEDTLSLRQAFPDHPVVGVPGVGVLQHLTVAPGARIIICRDGDPANHPASMALARGLDHLLLQRADVRVTVPPENQDNNDILLSGGEDALRTLIAAAKPATLSVDGEAARLAGLTATEYDQQRKEIASRLHVRVGTLDRAVADARNKVVQLKAPAGDRVAEEPEWQGTIDLGAALEAGLAELQRYVVASEVELATCMLWCAHAHLAVNSGVKLPRSPRLKLESRLPGSGKTTLAEAAAQMCPRQEFMSSYTASSVFRMLQDSLPTLVLDEADRSIHQDAEITTILNAGYRRSTAGIRRTVETPDGGFRSERFNTFCPIIIAGIDPAPATVQERSIRILLKRAAAGEVRDHLRDGSAPELIAVRLHLAAWAASQVKFTEPPLPEWLRGQSARAADNWCLLLWIAEQAGGRWPALLQEAAVAELTGEREPTLMERLLVSIRACFDAQPAVVRGAGADEWHRGPDDQDRMQTATLISFLVSEPGEEWDVANRGRPITEYFLRSKLRHLLTPPGSVRWHTRQGNRRVDHRGYERHQFFDAWSRYIPPAPLDLFAPSAPFSKESQEDQRFDQVADGGADPAAGTDARPDPTQQKAASEAGFAASVADGSDGADQLESEREAGGGLAELVRQLRAERPDWSTVKIAKQLGQPRGRIEAILADEGPVP